MKRYDSYKDSGVEWIGEIPNHWEKSPVKYYYDYKKGSRGQELTKTYIQNNIGEYPVYSGQTKDQGVLGKINDYEFDFSEEVIFTTTVGVKMMSTKVLRNKFSLSQNCLIMIPKREINSRFVNYYISVDWVFRKLQFPKILQPSLRMEDIDQYFFYCPTSNEQQQIVSFLDTKTSLIDSLIEKTQRKVGLLKEKRTSLINELVTKGLNHNLEMKDSGIEWIGEIPSGWKTSKLGFYTTKIGSGSTPRGGSEVYVESGVPFIRSQNVHFDGLKLENISHIEHETHKSMKGSTVIKNDVLLNITGGSIGRCCIVNIEGEMNTNQHVSIIRTTNNLLNVFLNYILNSDVGQSQVIYNISGGNREGLTIEGIRNFRITLPSITEQKQIVEYLDEQTQLIDNTISLEEKRTELLKEYRQSLIYEVVTGKRKVV